MPTGTPLSFTAKKLRLAEGVIQTYVFGTGNRVLVALPSFPHSGIFYRWLFNSADFRKIKIIVFDIPGWVGISALDKKKTQALKLTEMAVLTEKIISHYCSPNDKVSLMGYSFGGAVAIKVAARYMVPIDRVILVSTLFNTAKLNHRYKSKIEFCQRFKLGWLVKKYVKHRFNLYAASLSNTNAKQFFSLYKDMIEVADGSVMMSNLYELLHSDLSADFEKMNDIPTLIINSSEEDPLFRQQAKSMRLRLKDELSLYTKGTHSDFFLRTDPEIINSIVEFIHHDTIS